MHCNTLKKYWYKIPFPARITLVEAVEIIEKYIEMYRNGGRKCLVYNLHLMEN